MNKFLGLVLLLPLIIGPSGCYNRLETNDTVAVTGFGLDIEGNQKTLLVQIASPSGKSESGGPAPSKSIVLKENAPGYALAARQMLLRFPRIPVWSLASTFVIGESAARDDLALLMDFFTRNRFIRPNMVMFLARGSTPAEIMLVKTPPEDYSMVALEQIIRGQEQQAGIYQPVTLREFRNKYTSPGVEPVIPGVEISESDGEKTLRLSGSGVFRDNHLVGWLNERESRGFRFMSAEPIHGGIITVNTSNDSGEATGPLSDMVSLEIVRSRASIMPEFTGGQILMKVVIEADGNLYEQASSADLQSTEGLARLEALASQSIQGDVEACIRQAQALQSDIFGWGNYLSQNHQQVWRSVQDTWPHTFGSLQTNIKVQYKVRRSYLIEKPVPVVH